MPGRFIFTQKRIKNRKPALSAFSVYVIKKARWFSSRFFGFWIQVTRKYFALFALEFGSGSPHLSNDKLRNSCFSNVTQIY